MPGSSEHIAIARNALSSYAARAVLGVAVLLLTPYLFRALGPGGFGTWSVIFGLTTVALVLQIGFSQGLTKLIAELRGQGRQADVHETMGAGVALMAAAGLAILGVAVIVALALPGLAAEGQEDDFALGMLLVGAALTVRMPCMACAAALVGYQRYDLANIGGVTTTVAFAVLAVAAIETGAGVAGVAGAQAVALLCGGAVYAVTLRRLDPHLGVRPRRGQRAARSRILRFSSFTLLADSMVLVGQRLDVVVIAGVVSAAAAGPYAAIVKLQSGLQSLTRPFIDLLMPMVADLTGRGRRTAVLRRLTVTTRLALQISIPVAAALIIFAADVVDVWLGDGAPDATSGIVVVLMVANILGLVAVPATEALIGLGRVRLIGALAVGEGVLNVGLSILLVATYGAIGAAIGTLASIALLGPLRVPIAVRAAGGTAAGLLREGVWLPMASSVPSVAAMVIAHQVLSPGWERIAVGSACGIGAALLVGAVQVGPGRMRAALRIVRPRAATG
ncbi:MAG: lipopolysaccharide biosynthesis protein [Solirubrobacterales bacterium]|nr:lipopolysaccharide biosynthesis protein [Solirubrobacterales bacterium]